MSENLTNNDVRLELRVCVAAQRMDVLAAESGEVLESYVISSAANGVGFEEGSFCTPVGNFEVSEKHGDGAELGTMFVGRKPVGVFNDGEDNDGENAEKDHVLTRILWLHGLDEANANTKARYIYIHGTNHEQKIGVPASCGCIRMKNADIVELYEKVPVGTKVVILERAK